MAIDVESSGIALLSFCAHKLGGPKGVGALYVRRRPRPALRPLQFGGGHERGLRSGTLAQHQLIGFGAACMFASAAFGDEAARIRTLRERLWDALQAAAPLWRNGTADPSMPGILNVGFAGIEGESLLLELDGGLQCRADPPAARQRANTRMYCAHSAARTRPSRPRCA